MKKTVKAVVSTLLIAVFLCLAFTGVLLHFGKTGVVWGISRSTLTSVHFWAAVLMFVLTTVHFVLNFKLYLAGLRKRNKKDIGEGDAREGRR